MKNALEQNILCLSVAFALAGCGVEFDSIGQLEGLRVLGVYKDIPVTHPGDTVEMQLVVHDTGDAEGKPRDISYMWLGGCDNPPGDAYQGCLLLFSKVTEGLSNLIGRDPNELTPEQLAEAAETLSDNGVSLGFGETFQLAIPPDIISNKAPGPVPDRAPYALSYTFFAACAGELRPDPESETFPVGCFDGDTRLGARDFVAGYTPTYTYEEGRNSLPRITGMKLAGKNVPADSLCIGEACERPEPDPDRKCPKGSPTIERCDDGTLRQQCPKVELAAIIDPESVDQDAPIALGGEGAPEPMWVNYHTDHGSFANDVALVNDVTSGFRANPKTEFYAPEQAGPAFVWAVVRDNRGGLDWARTTICVK